MKKYIYLFSLFCLFACKKDLCKELNCQNGGTCNANGLCECAIGYEGLQCEIATSKKFIGNYHAVYDCVSAEHIVAIEIKPGTDPLALTIRNLGDYLCTEGDYLIDARISHDTIFLQNQPVCMNVGIPSGYTFNGIGKHKGDTLNLSYTVSYSTSHVDNCHAVLVKE